MSRPVLLPRIRNRLFEYLAIVAYADTEGPTIDTAELLEIWEDWGASAQVPELENPPLSAEEAAELEGFAQVWLDFQEQLLDSPSACEDVFAHSAWPRLRDAARSALSVLKLRGRFAAE